VPQTKEPQTKEKERNETKIMRRRPPRFDLIAGNVALDFINTLDDRYIKPKELLVTYADLVRFAEDSGVLVPAKADHLTERSHTVADQTQEILRHAKEMREAIHDVFFAFLHKQPVPPAALARLNADAQTAAGHMQLLPGKQRFRWEFDNFGAWEAMLWPIARAASDLLASDQLVFVRACFSKTCEWMFLDTSKNHQRRWCDMTRCGNRAKVQRFYARKKKNG
jgi:predicted RNA-binding Zn ribbon-like protein